MNGHGQHFIFDGCDTVALAEKYGTPLYLLSETRIRERMAQIRAAFLEPYPDTAAAFASKSLQTLELCRIVAAEGLCLDVVSGGELYAALASGFPPERIFFHGNNKTPSEIDMAVESGVGRMVVDNMHELELLDKAARARAARVKILYRLTPGVDSHTHRHIDTGRIDSKFGIPLDRAVIGTHMDAAASMPGVQLMGFHFHVGSQLLRNDSHIKALEAVLELMRELASDRGFVTRELNLGGGYGIRYAEEEPPPLSHFVDPMMELMKNFCAAHGLDRPRVIIEPGRWIVGEAGISLYRIGSIKTLPGLDKTYVAVDGGMTDNPRPALYGAKYDALIANKYGMPASRLVTIAGKCCESGDILIEQIALPEPEPGDILAVFSTGAYNHSMASNYNRTPRPALVMTRAGSDRLSVRRESYDDLIAREL